ncbi:MAG: hypothetical protein M3Q49_16535 [Actinomycetota bacterium]|jgi:hypothetical protein|nr:hypothetical protein [Actinomycetota bacterium]MDP9487363.1 hypothetical protein [Actinomycetota bacterium]
MDMDFLGNLMGGGDDRRRDEYRDFASRYDEGAPYDRISDEEAMNRYREVAPNLSEDDYRESAREAFSRMSPEERMQFGQQFRGYAHEQGYGDFIDRDHDGQDDRFQDPDYLASMTGRMHSRQPDMLGNLMGGMMGGGNMMGGGGMGGGMGNMLGGLMGGGGGGGMMGGGGMGGGNPMAKAAMAGIAAMAVKRMMR